jgi:Flp pilus assembly protein CpaB
MMLTLSLSGGLLAALVATKFLVPPRPQNISVVVARQALPRGTAVKDYEKLFEVVEVPSNIQLPANYLTSLDPIRDKARDQVLKEALAAGEPLSASNLVERSVVGLPVALRSGYLGLAVHVAPEWAAGGNVEVEDHVNVFGIQRLPAGERRGRLLMKNIRVVAVGRLQDVGPEKKGPVPSTVTLEVTDEEARKLREAQEDGPLALGVMPYVDLASLTDRQGDVVPPPVLVKVLVAQQEIAVGTPLDEAASYLVLKAIPKEQTVGKAYVTGLDQLMRRGKPLVFQKPLPADQPFSWDYLGVPRPRPHVMTIINGLHQGEDWRWDKSRGHYVGVQRFDPSAEAADEDAPPPRRPSL